MRKDSVLLSICSKYTLEDGACSPKASIMGGIIIITQEKTCIILLILYIICIIYYYIIKRYYYTRENCWWVPEENRKDISSKRVFHEVISKVGAEAEQCELSLKRELLEQREHSRSVGCRKMFSGHKVRKYICQGSPKKQSQPCICVFMYVCTFKFWGFSASLINLYIPLIYLYSIISTI